MRTINVGLIGYGVAGRVFHAPIITGVNGLVLKSIRETKPENIAIANTRYPGTKIVNDVKDIFSDNTIDLVVIATPNTAHFPLAKEALLAGKAVVVEKPFTITTAEADELISLAKEQGRLLTVYQNRRFTSDFKTIQKVLGSKILGKLMEYEAHYDRFRNVLRKGAWREENIPGAGILYDLGAHLIDQVQLIFGLPEEINSDVRIQREGAKAVDNFELILHYPDNFKVTLKAGMLVRAPGPQVILIGNNGSFIKHELDVQEAALKAGLSPSDSEDWGVEPPSSRGTLNTAYNDIHIVGKVESERGDYREFYANVYKTLIGGEELLVTPVQARNTIRIIELAIRSSEEKRVLKFSW